MVCFSHPFSFIEKKRRKKNWNKYFSPTTSSNFFMERILSCFFYEYEHKWSGISMRAYAADTLWQSIDHSIVVIYHIRFFHLIARENEWRASRRQNKKNLHAQLMAAKYNEQTNRTCKQYSGICTCCIWWWSHSLVKKKQK